MAGSRLPLEQQDTPWPHTKCRSPAHVDVHYVVCAVPEKLLFSSKTTPWCYDASGRCVMSGRGCVALRMHGVFLALCNRPRQGDPFCGLVGATSQRPFALLREIIIHGLIFVALLAQRQYGQLAVIGLLAQRQNGLWGVSCGW